MSTADPLTSLGAGGGNTLGKHRLIAELGRGGMSEVFLACAVGPAGFNKLTVIKQIKAELAEDPDFVTMFLEEARLAARLSHPNVVQTNEVGQDHGRYFIAMEYLEGQPYSRVLNRLGRDRGLPLGVSLRILCDVCAGLHHAHELTDYNGSPLEVVHRDVTPHNVFITYQGQVKIVDFGIAKAMNSSLETRTGVLKGKVGYMAPEQARGERVDRRADIFSVGVMLWEAAVGRRLWKGLSEVAVLHRLLHGEIPRPREMRPDISDRLEAIIMGALAVDRDHRYPSAAALQADLEELVDGPGMRTTVREIGHVVERAFYDDRVKLRQIVEHQLGQAQALSTGHYQAMRLPVVDQLASGQSSGELPVMRVSPEDESGPRGSNPALSVSGGAMSGGSAAMPASSVPPTTASPTPLSGTPAAGAPPTSYVPPGYSPHTPTPSGSGPYHHTPSHQTPSHQTPSHNYAPYGGPHSTPGGHPSFTPAGIAPPAPEAKSTQLTIAALLIAVATGGLAAVLWYGVERGQPKPEPTVASNVEASKPATEPATPIPGPATTTAPSATTDPVATAVSVEITLTPEDAVVRVDGKPATLPLSLAPGRSYEIEAEAPGHDSQTKTLSVAAGDAPKVTFDLPKKKSAGGGTFTAPPPKTPFDEDMKPPTDAPKRPLDGDNPYAQ